MRSVAIVGTGLIGASFGLALRRAGFEGPIVGVSSGRAIAEAMAAGAIDRGAPLAEAVPAAGLIFLSQTIGRILDTMRHLDPLVAPDALVTDAGSTKAEIVQTARRSLSRCQFLGGHPMAGKESRGAAQASADLFEGRTWALTPAEAGALETKPAREFRAWLEQIGARVVVLDPEEHDRAVALTSHLPQLASTALGAMLEQRPVNPQMAGPGLIDMTRLALGSYDVWRDILATNSGNIESALSGYIQELEHLRDNLRTSRMEEEFGRAARLAARVRQRP